MAGIYIHIPFCRQACHYCDFHFSTNLTNKERLVSSICKELTISKEFLGNEKIETIYFGGGSPSLLTYTELNSILETVNKNYQIISSPEITLEGNPDDLSYDYLKTIASFGVNRLSIGIQSFDSVTLKFLNRVHTSSQSEQCLDDAVRAGFDNFSIDLIYGIPSENHLIWENDVKKALEVMPKHISAYCLTIEDKTAFGNWLKKGKLKPVDEDFAAVQYEYLINMLVNQGYEHYEISNFALPGFYSNHNSSYWRQKKYLGIGPGAHSYDGQIRRFNIENNNSYIADIEQDIVPYSEELLSVEDKINEFLLTSLRTSWGTDFEYLKRVFQFDLAKTQAKKIEKFIKDDLVTIDQNKMFLTRRGKLLADKITEELMVDPQ